MRYQTYYHDWSAGNSSPYSVMDMRGAAQVSPTEWIICGGMDENQKVTNRTFLLTYDPITGGVDSSEKLIIYVYNNMILSAQLFDLNGNLIESIDWTTIKTIYKGFFILSVKTDINIISTKIMLR
jgi:hypothetical protein